MISTRALLDRLPGLLNVINVRFATLFSLSPLQLNKHITRSLLFVYMAYP